MLLKSRRNPRTSTFSNRKAGTPNVSARFTRSVFASGGTMAVTAERSTVPDHMYTPSMAPVWRGLRLGLRRGCHGQRECARHELRPDDLRAIRPPFDDLPADDRRGADRIWRFPDIGCSRCSASPWDRRRPRVDALDGNEQPFVLHRSRIGAEEGRGHLQQIALQLDVGANQRETAIPPNTAGFGSVDEADAAFQYFPGGRPGRQPRIGRRTRRLR